jgi:hypothetical protein
MNIIELAKQAGGDSSHGYYFHTLDKLQTFAELIRADERTKFGKSVGYGVLLPTGIYGNIYTHSHEAEEDFSNWRHVYPTYEVRPLYALRKAE